MSKKWVVTGRATTNRTVYHTDKTCPQVTQSNVRKTTDNEIAYFDLEECDTCKHGGCGGHDEHTEWHKINQKLRDGEISL